MSADEKVVKKEIVHKSRIFTLTSTTIEKPDGSTRVFDAIEHPGAVVIFPQLDDGRFVLVRQWRRAIGESILEFPAGTLESGERPVDCAHRELIEETSYSAAEWIDLGYIYPVPGYSSEKLHCFLARGLTPLPGELDEDEEIEVVTLTEEQLFEAVREGSLTDSKSLALIARVMVRGE